MFAFNDYGFTLLYYITMSVYWISYRRPTSPIYVGVYVDDIIYFSASDSVERHFKNKLSTIGNVELMGQVTHFLGIEFTGQHHHDGHLSISLTQQSFAETLIESLGFPSASVSTYSTPYRSVLPIDSIVH